MITSQVFLKSPRNVFMINQSNGNLINKFKQDTKTNNKNSELIHQNEKVNLKKDKHQELIDSKPKNGLYNDSSLKNYTIGQKI